MAENTKQKIQKFQGLTAISSPQFIAIFKKFDVDNNGYIEKSELDAFFKELIKEKKGEVDFQSFKEQIMKDYDENSDNKISMDELAKILPTEENFLVHFRDTTHLHVSDFMKIWYHYDQDKSGFLESNELLGFLHDVLESKNQNDVITPKQLEEYTEVILDLFDKNKDGKLELSELSKILPLEENFLNKINKAAELTRDEFEKLFQHYDQDGNGYIEDTELMGFLKDLLQNKAREPTTHDLEQYRTCILEISDKDNDGKLSKEELELLLFANKSKDES